MEKNIFIRPDKYTWKVVGFILLIIDILFIIVVVSQLIWNCNKICILYYYNINTSIDKFLFVIIDKNINI